jgi:hypothetical protein
MCSRRSIGRGWILAPVAAGAILLPNLASASAGAATTSTTATPGPQAPLNAAQAAQLAKNPDRRVIVVFKDQVTSIPATAGNVPRRAAAVAGVQAPVVSELRQVHAAHVTPLQLVNAVTTTVSAGEEARLAANPAVARVVPDEPIPLATSPVGDAAGAAKSGGITPLPGACEPNGQVQLDPEAVEAINAASQSGTGDTAQALGYTGAGVKVAFIADGLDIDNPDFIRPDGQHVFVDYQDFSGTGTKAPTDGGEAFLDASSIAAQGRETYNIASYAGLDQPCNIRILGVAPGASLVGLNVFGSADEAFNSVFLEAINYAVTVDHVNVINESFGGNPYPDQGSLDLTRMANDAAIAAGVTVTVSSGDAGVTNTIGSPATDPLVISAGASTTYRAYAQTGIGGINYPTVQGWLDDNISGLSSGGEDQTGRTVDVVAPGDLNWALCTPKPKKYAACTNFFGKPASVEFTGGTSESSPLTAGTAALVIQAYEEAHGGTAPTPAVVKQIIVSTAEDISAPGDQQGAGLIDAYAAVQAAASYPTSSSKPIGHALLKSALQLNAVAPTSTPETFSDTVTNTGASSQTVALSTRTLGPPHVVASKTVDITDATGDEAVVTFTVPPGQARLSGSIAYVGAGNADDFNSATNLSLISPSGDLAGYSIPQGTGNYSNTQVANPEPGTWTAVIFGLPSVEGGSTGPVQFAATTSTWASFGDVSPSSLTLGPSASAPFTLSVRTPATPGDVAGSVVLTSSASQPSFAATTTVPVVLRSLVPTPDPQTTFTGTLTGGNGRQSDTGVADFYQVDIPPGLPELNASVSTPNAANTFVAELVDPSTGEAASTASNAVPSGGGTSTTPELGAQLHVLDPDPGTWTLILNFFGQVSGTAISQPYTVTLDRTPVPTTSTLPDSSSVSLPVGKATFAQVRVTNPGTVPEEYFVDARLDQSATLNLASITDSMTPVPITGTPPIYIVPSHTTSITASATAPAPIFFDYSWVFGDPDILANAAPYSGSPSGTFDSNPVVPGQWAITPFQMGPDGAHGVPPVNAQTTMTATTAPFDAAVTSPTADLWLQALDPTAPAYGVVVPPGATTTIPVTITPSAKAGSVVAGTLYVDDLTVAPGSAGINALPPNIDEASDVEAIPYTYSVGPPSAHGAHVRRTHLRR